LKENSIASIEMSANQRRIFIDTLQIYDAYTEAYRANRSYRGGMHWKKAKGREYLFRTLDRYGYGKSLGLRTPETEAVLEKFRSGKQALKERLASFRERLREQARLCKAVSIQRVPRIVTGILRILDRHQLLGRNVTVIGTNAVYAYESAAGVFLDSPILATRDMDILWDVRSHLSLVALDDDSSGKGLLDLLCKADRSFELHRRQGFRAVNRDGYMVDLVKPGPRLITTREQRRMGGKGDMEAAEIRNLHWLVSSPKFSQVVIGDDGCPAPMICPDPRAFALHKLWLSEQPDRDPLKKKRDRLQAIAVAGLVHSYLPQYQFVFEDMRMFPKKIFETGSNEIKNQEPPAGI